MKRVGFEDKHFSIESILPSEQVYGYRNRCQVKTDGTILGFISENSHNIAPIQDCIVLNGSCRKSLKNILNQLPHPTWQGSIDTQQNWHFIEFDDSLTR